MEIKKIIENSIKISEKNNHRLMLVLEGKDYSKFFEDILIEIFKKLFKDKKIAIFTDDKEVDYIKKISEDLKKEVSSKVKIINFKDSLKVLGKTFDIIIVDFVRTVNANDIGRIFELCSGGGVIINLIPEREIFEEMITKFHKEVITPPYTLNDVKKIFNKWYYKKLLEHRGILIVDIEKKEVIKKFEPEIGVKEEDLSSLIPKSSKIDKRIYELAKSSDQINVLKKFEEFFFEDYNVYLILANRGRGKSASLGLIIAGLLKILKNKSYDIVVTARSLDNVITLFEFLEIGAKSLGIKLEKIKKGKYRFGKIYITFNKPVEVLNRKKIDLLIVDEAAGIYLSVLTKYLDKVNKIIFSTTIHGYEGCGRTFSVKFMKLVEKKYGDKKILVEMKKPIRYGENDPIEKFVYDVLKLDAEPSQLDTNDYLDVSRMNVSLQKLDLKKCFLGNKEEILTQFVGIYVLAHYRNKPNDLLLIADAPHHEGYYLKLNRSEKVVCSIQLAKEGGLGENYIKSMLEGESPKGNIIPDVLLKHYRIEEIGKLKVGRIVRIATHPNLMSKGLGSKALELLSKELSKKSFDYIGSSFGASYELLKFWIKNEFLPVHISPTRNPTTGEYSVIVIKPLNEDTKKLFNNIRLKFKVKFIKQLPINYRKLDPSVARLLLTSFDGIEIKENIFLDEIDKKRLEAFLKKKLIVDPNIDVLFSILEQYFLLKKNIREEIGIDPMEECILIAKVMQGMTFKKIKEIFKIGREKQVTLMRKGIKKIYNYFFKKS